MSISSGQMAVAREMAITSRLLQSGARCIDKIKDGLEITRRSAQRMAGHHDARAAMSLAVMLKSELNLDALRKMPLGEKTDSLGRPLHLFLGHINRIGKANGHSPALCP